MSARLAPAVVVALLAASCGGDGVISLVDGPPPNDAPTLTSLQSSIFTPQCAIPGCHASPAPAQGMDLSAGQTFLSTVGVDATQLSAFKRVAPGHASDSYLYMKIAGDPRIAGDRMPLGGAPLGAAELESVRLWIDAGAMDN